ncbi:MAG: aldehyde ferredoxin oxidoreductase [Anaerolineales bacterium]|nr:aldehyde ferredoxin oxidoreductase [Anaerolineales bacterium]
MEEFTLRILELDLSNGEIGYRTIPQEEVRLYLGGSSLGARILYPSLVQDLDPLSPEAPLLFMTGPLTGTRGPSVGRSVLCAKSPLTELWGESNIGGFWGSELRRTGFDGLLIRGKATSPVYIWVHNDEVEIKPADHLWGVTDTYKTQDRIKEELELPNLRVACIGKAGEVGIPFATVMCDHGRVAGRTGMGAIMGSKGIKAIAVYGTKDLPIMQKKPFQVLRSRMNVELEDENVSRAFRDYGTSSGIDYLNYLGAMPKRYFTYGGDDDVSEISGQYLSETILVGKSACQACVIACGRVVQLEEGPKRKGPEFETIAGFGSLLGIYDLSRITILNELADVYGIDTISLSNTIGLAYLLYQEGIITKKDTNGLELHWGDADAAEKLIHDTVRQEGIGALIAQGSRRMAEHYDVIGMAAQVNGLEVAYHDPRAFSGMALVYATSPRGACHNQSEYFMVDGWGRVEEDLGMQFYGRQEGAAKASTVAKHQDWQTIFDALIMCKVANVPVGDLVDLVNYATGFDYSKDEFLMVGERAWNLKRVINHRLGLTAENDKLPDILMKPLDEGGAAGYVPPFDEMIEAYYGARGWDSRSGRPTPDTLNRLGLSEMITDIWA